LGTRDEHELVTVSATGSEEPDRTEVRVDL